MTAEPITPDAALTELADLRQQVASLKEQLNHNPASIQPYTIYYNALKYLPLGIAIYHFEDLNDPMSLRIVLANSSLERFTGMDAAAFQGRPLAEAIPIDNPRTQALIRIYADALRTNQVRHLGEIPIDTTARDGEATHVAGVYTFQVIPLANQHLCIVIEDVTERKQAEAALVNAKLQEEVIRAQEAALAELSTPLLTLGNGVLVMPLVGTIDSRRAAQVMERLLEGVSEANARAVILDITGIPIVDTQVANAFIRAAQAVKLLGAQVIITGIRPEVAQTLVSLHVDLSGIITRSTLESGIADALAR